MSNPAEAPSKATLTDRVELMKRVLPDYVESFREAAEERQRRVDNGELLDWSIDESPIEQIWFDNVTLEINEDPSIYLVDYNFRKLIGPRLELHLAGPIGAHRARLQMGRIARFIEARSLADEYTDISAITYVQLALGAVRITHMRPALLTYVPHNISGDAYARGNGAFQSANRFLARHGRDPIESDKFTFDSQSLPTTTFVKHWRDFGIDEEE